MTIKLITVLIAATGILLDLDSNNKVVGTSPPYLNCIPHASETGFDLGCGLQETNEDGIIPQKLSYEVTFTAPSQHYNSEWKPPKSQDVTQIKYIVATYFMNTGNEAIDALLKSKASNFYYGQIKSHAERGVKKYHYIEETYSILNTFYYKPSKSIISFLFCDGHSGGAHNNAYFEMLSFDLKTGKQLAVIDVFPNPDKSIRQYWNYIYTSWADDNPFFFECHNIDEMVTKQDFMFENIILTLGGAVFLVDSDSSCIGAMGSMYVNIPKEKMIEFGANPKIWGQ